MIKRIAAGCGAVLAMVAGLIAFAATPASAHEERTVGAYRFLVGFGDEPPYAGLKNSVQLILSDSSGKPVTTLTDSLKVEVVFGTQKTQLSLEPTFDPDTGLGTPGDYRAWFIATSPGTYSFHFFGSIGNQQVDQTFTSGPTTFANVSDPATVEFPTKVPTGAELSTRLDRETARLGASLAGSAKAAKDDAKQAKTFAFVGIGIGVIGIVVGAVALASARRRVVTTAGQG